MVGTKCLCILGMHRSGTSCLTGIAQQYGIELGEVFTENPYNRRGNRESAEIQALNNDVLAFNNGNWDHPVDIRRWNHDLIVRRDRIIKEISCRSDTWWGFKDPRVILTLPFWQEGVDQMNYFGTFRHPARVAMSLTHRDRKSTEEGVDLWLNYNRRLLQLHRQYQFPIVDFDMDESEYLNDVQIKLKTLGITTEKPVDFYDATLRHHTNIQDNDYRMSAAELAVYQDLKQAAAQSRP